MVGHNLNINDGVEKSHIAKINYGLGTVISKQEKCYIFSKNKKSCVE